jgi:hypothetical protein
MTTSANTTPATKPSRINRGPNPTSGASNVPHHRPRQLIGAHSSAAGSGSRRSLQSFNRAAPLCQVQKKPNQSTTLRHLPHCGLNCASMVWPPTYVQNVFQVCVKASPVYLRMSCGRGDNHSRFQELLLGRIVTKNYRCAGTSQVLARFNTDTIGRF